MDRKMLSMSLTLLMVSMSSQVCAQESFDPEHKTLQHEYDAWAQQKQITAKKQGQKTGNKTGKKTVRVIKKTKKRCSSCNRNPILVHDPYYVAYDPWPYSGSGPYWSGGWGYYGFRPYMGIGFSWGCC